MITQRLLEQCKSSWQQYGYKKTSIDLLCREIGISKGSFYSFFDSKEAMFYQVLRDTQQRLYAAVEAQLARRPGKQGVALALKEVYAQYSKSSFMYDTRCPDFLSFYYKLSDQQRQELNESSYTGARLMLNKPYLSLKIDEALALSVLSALLAGTAQADRLLCGGAEVFGFMIDHLIDHIFD